MTTDQGTGPSGFILAIEGEMRRDTVERMRHRIHRGRYRADWSVAQIEQVDSILNDVRSGR